MPAYLQAMRLLEAGHSCSEGVCRAISILEVSDRPMAYYCLSLIILQDSYLTNAGRGSNLTLTGTVECDASIMESGGGFGAIGAASGLSNHVNIPVSQ